MVTKYSTLAISVPCLLLPAAVFIEGHDFHNVSDSQVLTVVNQVHVQDDFTVFITARERPDSIIDWNRQFLPVGSEFKFFTDATMDKSVRDISSVFENEVKETYEAFQMLRPFAFRADLWRVMVLWMYGGLYMDHKIMLTAPLSDWIEIRSDSLVLPNDMDNGYWVPAGEHGVWNSILFSREPRHLAWEFVLRYIVSQVQKRSYGENILAISGPVAMYNALKPRSFFDATRNVVKTDESGSNLTGCAHDGQLVLVDSFKPVAVVDKYHHDQTDIGMHYWQLYTNHQVYCDEPGPLCKSRED